eukprot:6301323-Ditylum_brightwellii.AAC.1
MLDGDAASTVLLDTTTILLENVSQADHSSGQFDRFNKDNNNNAISKDDCNSNCITQDTLDDLPLIQDRFTFEKIEALRLFAKVPKVFVRWVGYDAPTWEPL